MDLRSFCWPIILGLSPNLVIGQGFNRHYDAYGSNFAQGSYGIEEANEGWMTFSFSYEPDTITPDSILGVYVIVLQRLDLEGNVTLEKRIQYPGHSIFLGWADCCDSTHGDGGFVIGGGSKSYLDVDEARLMRLTATGDTLWTKTYGAAGQFWIGSQVKQTNDGGFILCGYTDATGNIDGFALKADSLGNEEWRHTYGLGSIIDDFSCIALLPDSYVMSGTTTPSLGNINFQVTKIDTLGNEIWTNRFGSPFKEPSPSILRLVDGRLLLGGAWAADANGWETPYVAFIDPSNGEITSSHLYGTPQYGRTLFASKQFPNSDLIHCGVTYDGGNEQGLLLRTNSGGDSLWLRTYFYYDTLVPHGQGRFWDVLPTADNGCIASGFANSPFDTGFPPGRSQDTWVVKVDSMGCVVPGCDGITGITEVATNLGEALQLYPNPVRDQLHVGISLPQHFKISGPLTLTVTSLAGQVVLQEAVLQEAVPTSPSPREKGLGDEAYEVLLNVSGLASGMYSVHLSDANTWIAGKKFVVE